MVRWPQKPIARFRYRWRRSPFHGGLLGIASVAMATVAIGVACAAVTLVVTWIY